jgi:hypothetical protein
MTRERELLREALDELVTAADDIEECKAYASDYFREKWGLDTYAPRVRATVARIRVLLGEPQPEPETIDPGAAVTLMRERTAEDVENSDQEGWHAQADDVLVEVLRSLGYGELCDAYDEFPKWYA